MRLLPPVSVMAGVLLIAVSPAAAQRMPFERTLTVTAGTTLDVSTLRGKIEVTDGAPGRMVVAGSATVRVGLMLPWDAVELAKKVAAQPPIQQDATTVRLTEPTDPDEQRAVIVNYVIQVPPGTRVRTTSDSGATTVRGVSGPVEIRTHSAAINASALGAGAVVTTGSGAVEIAQVAGGLSVTTQSSAIELRAIAGDVRVRTGSGAVDVSVTGQGSVDIETGSSAIRVIGASGSVTTTTRSGATELQGRPGAGGWTISSGSGSVDMHMTQVASFRLDAQSGSGSVRLQGAPIAGTVAKKSVTGTVGAGGALVEVRTRSGSVRVTLADAAATR